jgi:hypothetical protein
LLPCVDLIAAEAETVAGSIINAARSANPRNRLDIGIPDDSIGSSTAPQIPRIRGGRPVSL